MKFNYSKFESQNILWQAKIDWNEPGTTPNKKQNKEKPPSLWATNDIDIQWFWIACSQFLFKIKHSFDTGQRNEIKEQ